MRGWSRGDQLGLALQDLRMIRGIARERVYGNRVAVDVVVRARRSICNSDAVTRLRKIGCALRHAPALAALGISIIGALGQAQPDRELAPHQSVFGAVPAGRNARYVVHVPAGYSFLVSTIVAQAPLTITLRDPEGSVLSQSRRNESLLGAYALAAASAQGGTYIIELAADVSGRREALYELRMIRLQQTTPSDAAVLEAEEAIHRALESYESQPAAAMEYAAQAAKVCEADREPLCVTRAAYVKGFVHSRRNRLKEADAEFESALQQAARLEDRYLEAMILKEMVLVKFMLGDYRQALAFAKDSVERARQAGSGFLQAYAYSRLCSMMVLGNAPKDAELVCRNAIEIASSTGALLAEADAKIRLASMLSLRDDPQAAKYGEAALQVFEAYGDTPGAAYALSILTAIRLQRSDFRGALEFAAKARRLYEAGGMEDPIGDAENLALLGSIFERLNDHLQALVHFQRAAEVRRLINDKVGEARAMLQEAEARLGRGDIEGSMAKYHEILSLSRSVTDRASEATALAGLGAVVQATGDLTGSESWYRQAVSVWKDVGNVPQQTRLGLTLGGLARSRHEYAAALDEYRKAFELANSVGAAFEVALSEGAIGAVLRLQGKSEDARKAFEDALERMEALRAPIPGGNARMSWFQGAQKIYDEYLYLLMDMHHRYPAGGYDQDAFQVAERARSRVLLESLPGNPDPLPPALAARERELLEQIRRSTPSGERGVAPNTDRLEAQYAMLEAEILTRSPRILTHSAPEILSTREVSNRLLNKDRAVLEFRVCDERSFAWLITSTGTYSAELPGRQKLKQAVDELLDARSKGTIDADQHYWRAARALSDIVIRPVAARLATRQLLLVADDTLQRISFAGLPWPVDARGAPPQPLVEHFEIVQVPSASVAAAIKALPKGAEEYPNEIAVFANPESSGNRAYLPMSDAEGRTIIGLFPSGKGFLFAGKQASLRTLRTLNLADYRILHFSAHATVDRMHPDLSAIELSDASESGKSSPGNLMALDIYGLRVNTQLVVLSACETADGRDVAGEGAISLARAFLYAGAKSVISTIWPVADTPAALFSMAFYRSMLGSPRLEPAAALRRTQLALWRAKISPRTWAAFTIVAPGY